MAVPICLSQGKKYESLAPSGLLYLFFTSSSFPPFFTSFQALLFHHISALPRSLALHSSGLCLEAAVMQRRRESSIEEVCADGPAPAGEHRGPELQLLTLSY